MPRRATLPIVTRLAVASALLFTAAVTLRVDAHERITTKITWDAEISRIFQARCVSCHTEGGAAPMPLETYAQARPWARAIRDEVLARRMPKWHAARGYGDLPRQARTYLERISELTGVDIDFVSVGTKRDQIIEV